MGIKSWLARRRARKSATGTIVLKPSEAGSAGAISAKTGASISVPGGSIVTASTGSQAISGNGGGTSGGGGGGSSGGGGTTSRTITTTSPTQVSDLLQVSTTPSTITSLDTTSGLSAMQEFEASKMADASNMVIQASGGVRIGKREYIGEAIVPFSGGKTANQIRAEEQRKATARGYGGYGRWSSTIPIKKEETKETEGLDLIPKVDVKEIIAKKGDGKYKPFKKDSIPSFDPSKKIIFIKPSEMKGFTEAEGYSDFDVINLTKTTEGEGGEQLDSLSDFTSNLESGSYAISLSGDMQKVKEIGVSKDVTKRVEYAPDGSVLYSGGVSPVTKGMTKEEIKTWKSKLKESAKFEGLDFSIKPYVDVYKKEGIYEGTKYAITHPLIVKDIPVVKAGLPVAYKYLLESPVKGTFKAGAYIGDFSMQTGDYLASLKTGNRFYKPSENRGGKFEEFIDYDYKLSPLKDPDVQMFGLTTLTLGLAGAGSIGAKVLQTGGKLFQAHIVGQAIKNPTEENLAMALIFTAPEVIANRGKIIQEFSGKRPSQYVPNTNEIAYVSPTSRPRATLMIKNAKGEYLVSKKKGISSGGDIKAGETPRQAMIREVGEELGLSKKDFNNIKFKEKIVTPQETSYTFEATLKPEAKINSMSDMSGGIKWIGKSKYEGVTGQTYRNPVMKDGVRVYELAIMNRLSGNKKPVTWLGYESKYGKVYFGTQSRYDVPKKIAKEYAKMPEETLIHATPDVPFSMEFGKPLKVKPSKIKRGGEGLYVSPQVATKPIPKEVLKLEGYTGKGKPVKPKEIKDIPVKVGAEPPAGYVPVSYLDIGTPSRYAITFNPLSGFKRRGLYVTKGKVGKDIKLTKKALAEIESEQAIRFGREIKKKGRGEYIWIAGKKVRIRKVDILQKEMKATEPLGKEVKKSKTKKDESDLNNFLKDQEKRRTRRKVKTEEGITEYVSPYKFAISKKKGEIKRERPKEISKERFKEIKKEIPRDIPRDLLREIKREAPRTKPIEIPRDIPHDLLKDFPKEIPRYPSRPPKEPAPIIPTRRRKIIKKAVGKAPSYDVMIKSQGKYIKINKKPLGLKDARNVRDFGIDNSLSRDAYLKARQVNPSPLMYDISPTYSKDNAYKFRNFRQKKGKKFKLPKERKIEYSKYALDQKSEVKQINIFKVLAQREKKKRKLNRPSWESFA